MPFLAAIGGRCVHCLAGDVEVFCAATVGEDAEVADAMHAVGDDVEQEASDELIGGDGNGAVARLIGVPGLATPEGDGAAVEGEDAAVGDGDPVGVARQVAEHLLRSAEGWLGVDDPVLAAGFADDIAEGGVVGEAGGGSVEDEQAPAVGLLEFLEEEASEQCWVADKFVLEGRDFCGLFRRRSAWNTV